MKDFISILQYYLLPRKQWFLLWGKSGIPNSLGELNRIIPPKDRSWADPFPIVKDGCCTVFFEEVKQYPKRGVIVVSEITESGILSKPKVVLERPYHLSYPFVFEYDSEWWMVPESRSNKTVDLYHCKEWPDKWVYEKSLFNNCEMVDSTLFNYLDHWWLMAGQPIKPGGNASGKLMLWYADNPLSDKWICHPDNPITTDIRYTRPGGSIINNNSSMLRPAQDSSIRYGYAIRFMEIQELTVDNYKEKESQLFLPDWDMDVIANHTFNEAQGWVFADAAREINKGVYRYFFPIKY